MRKCQECESDRIFDITAKSSDLNSASFKGGEEHDGYAPRVNNVCCGDYVEFKVCLECGQIQGEWPVLDPDFPE